MSAKHTPGPWEVTEYESGDFTITAQGRGPCDGDICGTTMRPEEHDENASYANARLIAAAPELLEVLEMLVSNVGPSTSDIAVARAGLSKAKGGAR